MGRQSSFTHEVADAICERLANGESLRAICRGDGMPPEGTVRQWVTDDVHGFAAQYARARDAGLDHMAEEILSIADDGTGDSWTDDDGNVRTNTDVVQRSKLRVDARKWYLSKLAPKKYGEKMTVEHDVGDTLAERIKAARERTTAQG